MQQTTKNHIKAVLLLSAVAVIGLAIAAPVKAQVPPAATPAGSTIDQRLAQRKAERNVVLAEKDSVRLQTTCVSAQTKIRALQQKNDAATANRLKIYQQIDAKLWIMIGKLKVAEKDTFGLEKQRATLAEKTSVFQQTSAAYKQALDDAAVVNCKADPAGFKALVDTSRIYRTQVRDQTKGIFNYITNDVKQSLSTYANDLQTKPSTEEGR